MSAQQKTIPEQIEGIINKEVQRLVAIEKELSETTFMGSTLSTSAPCEQAIKTRKIKINLFMK